MTDIWADIRRLAGDLQRVQATADKDRLSESNCVEIVAKLISRGLTDVVYTCDGKEYITKKHLLTEIQNECTFAGGRISLSDLAASLHVDFSVVEQAVKQVIEDPDYFLSLDELVTYEFVRKTCSRLEQYLSEHGNISVLNLSTQFNLPVEFINGHILPEVGVSVKATRDGDQLYTDLFIDLQRNKLQALLHCTSRALPLSTFYNQMKVTESIFHKLVAHLSKNNELNGRIVGVNNSLKSTYVPEAQDVLARMWAKAMFDTQHYIPLHAFRKLSINDSAAFLTTIWGKDVNNHVVYLKDHIIDKMWYNQLVDDFKKNIAENRFTSIDDTVNEVTTVLSVNDVEELVSRIIQDAKEGWWHPDDSDFIFASNYVDTVLEKVGNFIKETAQKNAFEIHASLKDAASDKQQPKKAQADDDDDWNTGKGGKGKKGGAKKGGGGGKGKAPANKKAESSTVVIEIPTDDLTEAVTNAGVPEDVVPHIITDLSQLANQSYKREVMEAINSFKPVSGQDQKKAAQELQANVAHSYSALSVYDESTGLFEPALAGDLRSYLRKSVVDRIITTILDTYSSTPTEKMSPQAREKVVAAIPDAHAREQLQHLLQSTASLEDFYNAMETLDACGIVVKSPDKKTKAEFLAKHIADLRAQLAVLEDPPSTLLAVLLLLIALKANAAIDATGKFVGPLIDQLENVCEKVGNPISPDVTEALREAQQIVIKLFRNKDVTDRDHECLAELFGILKAQVLE
uniref:E3 UFM1-protein ligase 1 homolog n=1 Tax=Panagrellus redivivus TaxID=6233 RepID=A0A7E4VC24_PANRE